MGEVAPKSPKSSALDADLKWFFRDSAAAMGHRAMALCQTGDTGLPDTTPHPSVIEAATRYRQIAQLFNQLETTDSRILRAGHDHPPANVKRLCWRYGDMLALAVWLQPELLTVAPQCWDDETRPGRRAHKQLAKATATAEATMRASIKRYRDMRRQWERSNGTRETEAA